MLYGHTLPNQPETCWQTLDGHLRGTACLARLFAEPFGAGQTGELLGMTHDDGKRSQAFQNRLHRKTGSVDHSTAAGRRLLKEWRGKEGEIVARLLAYALLGHHGGIPDYGSKSEEGTLCERLYGKEIPDWRRGGFSPLPEWKPLLQEMLPLFCLEPRKPDPFAVSFMLRMLYSCLVDADFLDTERFCSPDWHGLRPAWPEIASLQPILENKLRKKGFLSNTAVNSWVLQTGADAPCGSVAKTEGIRLARRHMLQCCLKAAELAPGLFSLIMPTGGGKTLSSLAFALRHARRHGLRRVILVVPYTSIIEQNAEVLRQYLGDGAILEHHSNYVHPSDMEMENAEDTSDAIAYRMSTENWDATVIVTTTVQFFESLFSNRPSQCRKLHNMARSVIILDEVQMIPVPFVAPCVAALRLLVRKYHSSVVLCTATQPAFVRSDTLPQGFGEDEVRDIVPATDIPVLFRIFQRTTLKNLGVLSQEALAARLLNEPQVLCIVNSRSHARDLFNALGESEGHFHLSARMTPEHRSRVLKTVRLRLQQAQPCRLISTSLIECGADIDFPVVFREKNGLDVIAQAAGRCNREGRRAWGNVFCFQFDTGLPKRAADLARRCNAFDELQDGTDLLCPETVRDYFQILYARSCLDEKNILSGMTENNRQNKGLPEHFDFASIARAFRFIAEQTESVIIENEWSEPLLRQLVEQPSPALLRRLQRFSVQVARYEFEKLQHDGRIEDRFGFLHVLAGGCGYGEKTGLDMVLEQGIPVDQLLY